MKTILQRWLARHPLFYQRLWRMLKRGGIEKRIFLCLVRRGDVVCDIGANRGYFTRLFSDIVGTGGRVYAFEPGEAALKILRANLCAARCNDNVVVIEAAVGETAGVAELFVPGEVEGQASLRRQEQGAWRDGAKIHRQECRVVTLDDHAHDFTRLNFIKCDIEGAELPALRGARETLLRFAPFLFVEVWHEWMRPFGYAPEDLVAFLREQGYDDFRVAGDRLEPLERVDLSQPVNLLCAQRARHADRLAALEML